MKILIKRKLFGLMAAMILPLGAGIAQAQESTWERIQSSGVIRLGCANSEPYYYKDPASGEWSGIGPGIAALLAAELGVTWECVDTTWANAVAGLQANQFDLMVSMDATPQRALAVDFPSAPLFYYAVGVLVPKDAAVDEWADLNTPETKVAVPLGTSNDRAISGILTEAKFERTKGNPEAIASFAAGRANAVGGGSIWLTMQNAALGNAAKVVIPSPISASTSSIGVRKEADKRWRDWLSIAVEYYYHRGETQKIYDDFLRSRGIDPSSAPPIRIEAMK